MDGPGGQAVGPAGDRSGGLTGACPTCLGDRRIKDVLAHLDLALLPSDLDLPGTGCTLCRVS